MRCTKCLHAWLWEDSERRWCPQCGFEDNDYKPPKPTSVLPEAFRTSRKHCFYGGKLPKYKDRAIILVLNSARWGKTSHINPTITADCPYCRSGQVMQTIHRISRQRRSYSDFEDAYQSKVRLECNRGHVIDIAMSEDWNSASWMEIYD